MDAAVIGDGRLQARHWPRPGVAEPRDYGLTIYVGQALQRPIGEGALNCACDLPSPVPGAVRIRKPYVPVPPVPCPRNEERDR